MITRVSKNMVRYWLALLVMLLNLQVYAQTIAVGEKQTLAVNKLLRTPDGNAYTYVLTDKITNASGAPALGLHTVQFTLNGSSPYAVVLDVDGGNIVNPGETFTWQQNLSLSSSRLYFTFYPATANVVGTAQFTINIPTIYTESCPQGFDSVGDICQRVELRAATYQCPDNFAVSLDKCEQAETFTITAYCPEGGEVIDGTCRITESFEVNQVCDPGY